MAKTSLMILLALFTGLDAGAAAKKKSVKKAAPAQSATVDLGGATVYQSPSFDSKVLIQLEAGYKVTISLKTRPGYGGMGAFYRIKYAPNKLGYVADTEVIPQFRRGSTRKAPKKNPDYEKVEDLRQKVLSGRKDIILTRYWGLGINRVHFTERYRGYRLASDMDLYALRFTGPDVLFEGPPFDVNLAFSMNAPDHYKKLTGQKAAGFLGILDAMARLPFMMQTNYALEGALGFMIDYSRFRIGEGVTKASEQHLHLGLSMAVGAAYRIGKWIGRLDYKYHYNGLGFNSLLFTVQHEY